jgi:hypothetical protein
MARGNRTSWIDREANRTIDRARGRICGDCTSLKVGPDGFCRTCREHRADGHEPMMTFVYSGDGRIQYDDGFCHGHGPSGREGVTLSSRKTSFEDLVTMPLMKVVA